MAIKHFGYIPEIIQTDNGFEFTHFKDTKRVHPFDKLCNELGIKHQLIRPRTPRHNGKVEMAMKDFTVIYLFILMKIWLLKWKNISINLIDYLCKL